MEGSHLVYQAIELFRVCMYHLRHCVLLGGGSTEDKAGDSKQAGLSTRSSLGADYISSVH